ncbi:hypothetical protein [Streptomyces griseorubiginosus]|uniref:hypothetical protein n=1 Tax=Streptomyces griseorubiginosus TaxID=67304 RepID=UPI003404F089
MNIPAVPRIDEHTTLVRAGVGEVWQALLETLEDSFGRARTARYARLVGAADRAVSGPRPLAEGSAFPGFRVAAARPGRELVLIGRHHFSTYALIFRLDTTGDGRVRLRAESRARFPGHGGAVYRLLVIGTGAHATGVRHVLATVRRRALKGRGERRDQPPPARGQDAT